MYNPNILFKEVDMTEKQKVEVRLSEVKKELNTIGSKPEITDEDKTKLEALKTEYGDLETRFQALTISEEEPEKTVTEGTPEEREKAALIESCNIGNIFASVVEHRATDGVEAELQKELGLDSNQIPLSLLETRAVTPVPGTGDVQTNQNEILMPVFADTLAAFLGVPMPTVGTGDALYPILTNRPEVGGPHPHADSTAVAESTGAFEVVLLQPSRIQASFFWRRVDAARFAGLREALTMALNEGLGEKVDYEIFRGTEGLLTGTNLPNNAAAKRADYLTYVTQLGYGRVDGRYASSPSVISTVVGKDTYVDMSNQFRATESDRSALDRLSDVTGGVRVSAHVAAASSKKQLAVSRIGGNGRAAVAPIWDGITLIPDEITKADTGEIKITAVMLFSFKVIRKADWHKQEFTVA